MANNAPLSAQPCFTAWRGAGAQGALHGHYATPATAVLHTWLSSLGYTPNDLNAAHSNNTTALMHAARLGRADLIKALLRLGAQHQVRNADGNNALWLACFSNDRASIAALIDAGIDIDNQNDNGSTCLMYAASAGKADVVAQLLAASANVRLDNLDGFTALDMAASIECLRLLRNVKQRSRSDSPELPALDGAL